METLSLPRGSLSRSGSQLRLRRINGNFQRSLLPEGSDPSSQLRLRRINGNKFFLGDSRNRKSGSQLRLRRINGNRKSRRFPNRRCKKTTKKVGTIHELFLLFLLAISYTKLLGNISRIIHRKLWLQTNNIYILSFSR